MKQLSRCNVTITSIHAVGNLVIGIINVRTWIRTDVQTVFALVKRLKMTQYQFSILGLINRTNRVKVLGRMVPKVGSGAPPTRFLLLPFFCFSPLFSTPVPQFFSLFVSSLTSTFEGGRRVGEWTGPRRYATAGLPNCRSLPTT